jgi:PPK2 family polyphosphate:nucleotide phosphotransferase
MKYLELKDDSIVKRTRVEPGKKVKLKKNFDPGYKLELSKDESKEQLQQGIDTLSELQDVLYAHNKFGILCIFQAMDAAGKDGTIKHVMSGINPQGCQVFSFKAPSSEELDHDYLWRCYKSLPERGRIGIFNRSYYEEVLVTKVHPEILQRQQLPEGLVDKSTFKRRYEQINQFEKYLVENGIVVLKFFLNVSKEEQKKRFLDRIERSEKNWKFSVNDVNERAHWGEYMKAYEDCFESTSTEWAPWYVIPADHKPTTRVCVAHILGETLKALKLEYPSVSDEQRAQLLVAKKMLEEE